MNHIYRSIWNAKTGTFVAVSEHAKSDSRKASTGASIAVGTGFALKALSVSLLLGFSSTSYALPDGGVVAAGSAAVTTGNGGMTVNQSSQNVVLNWQSFNIGQGEAVRFVQPNSSSVALNRVLGADPSSILGSLSANGKVFLVNPNGILFGADASVNVGGLVASTRNISDSDFMTGQYKFSGTGGGSILNQGSINADGGYVALLGANISNEGIINARLGSVALAAGDAITLDVAGDGMLNVVINEGAMHALVNNGGMIQADGGQVLMTAQAAGNLLQTAVNNTGVIQAQTIENHNGVIKLLGDMQSGTVNVGGKLDASAPNGGNGGFIETSAAHVKLGDGPRVTTAAANGLTGSWLIDPADFTIAATGGDMTGAALGTSLGMTDVTIYSTSGSTGTAGDINVNDTVSWSANKLTLNAQNDININTAMNASGTASLALEYGQSAVAAGNTSTVNVNAPVNLPAGNNFSTKRGSDGGTVNYMVITDLGAVGSTSGTDLQGMNGGLAGSYALGADIDATATSGWNAGAGFAPVGSFTNKFSGTFDGLGHTISNLTINRPTSMFVGLFSAVTGTMKNVGVVAANVTGNYGVGGLAGYSSGSISNSYVTGTVTGAGSAPSIVGGLIGRNHGSARNSYATATVSTGYTGGGLIGKNYGSVSTSYATGAVSGNSYNGGLVGTNLGQIENSYSTGSVTGTSGSRHWNGGLVGINYSSISKSYATGQVIGGTGGTFGGLVGKNYGSATNSFWNTTTSGQSTSNGGLGMTSAQMMTQANFMSATTANGNVNPAWDTTSTWVIYDGHTAPLLRSFMTALTVTANDATRTYDATAYSGGNGVSYSSTPDSNLLGTLNYGGSSQGSVNAGSYAITPGGQYSTQQQGGYAITFVSGTLTINPEARTESPAGPSAESGGNITKIQNAIAYASSMEFVNSNENNIASSLVSSGLGTVGVRNVSATPGDTFVDSLLAGLNITVKEHGVNLPFGEQDNDKKIAD